MGYTHYWKFKQNPINIENGAEKFKQAVALFKKGIKIIQKEFVPEDEEHPFKLRDAWGKGNPIITDTLIAFNGDAENGDDYEGVYVPLDYERWNFDFCKTARRPYDVAVCFMLLCFKRAFGKDFEFSSDGDRRIREEGWKLAMRTIKKV